jgi:hypothetical protein
MSACREANTQAKPSELGGGDSARLAEAISPRVMFAAQWFVG